MNKSRKTVTKKDSFLAKLSFWLSMGFWVPLFNIGLAVASIIIAFKALHRKLTDTRFGGLGYIIVALAISFSVLIGSIIFLFIYLYRKLTCESLPL